MGQFSTEIYYPPGSTLSGNQHGGTSEENMARVKRQNERKISVIIGNPPYNAWQENYNAGNANRPYKRVDERIKATYIKEGTAQNQNSVYDMYTRFVRWASDRLGDEGIICFVIGRKPISKAAYDGFRKVVEREFSGIWLMDLGGDVRDNPKIAGTTHNVFGIQTGVTVAVLVREKGKSGAVIRYARRPEFEVKEDKLSFLGSAGSIDHVGTSVIKPDHRFDWLDQATGDWESLIPLFEKSKGSPGIFSKFSMGTQPKLDEWIYWFDAKQLADRMSFYCSVYSQSVKAGEPDLAKIKWHRELVKKLKSRTDISFGKERIRRALWRPYSARWYYDEPRIVSMNFLQQTFWCGENRAFSLSGPGSGKPFSTLGMELIPNHDLLEKAQVAPRYRYTKSGERVDNITDWAVARFLEAYEEKEAGPRIKSGVTPGEDSGVATSPSPRPPSRGPAASAITKDAIFAYCYAVLHDPVYREKYALNLKREFPRIPFYPDFAKWAAWGEALLKLHIGYETVKPFTLNRIDTPNAKRADGTHPKPKLKSAPELGHIQIDEETQLCGVPAAAWQYRLGNRSAIDWVLDQHKEKTPRDPTIRAKFNTYRFADYKESCIDLIAKVVAVSIETVAITEAMAAAAR